jgi:hypothetical protein
MNMSLRRLSLASIIISILCFIAAGSGLVVWAVADSGTHTTAKISGLAAVSRVPERKIMLTSADQVPVLVYHEMNNDCPASASVCHSHDYESVSAAQFTAEMAWMYQQGYHTITLPQYLGWLAGENVKLPSKPFLITVDNGIGDFLEDAQPILYHYRYTATAFIVTGFADGAAKNCGPRIDGVNVQPECPSGDIGWDLTWPQLKTLSPDVYSFGLEAGADGHYQQDYNKNCFAFDACELPGETSAAYETRVRAENSDGIAELTSELGTRFDSHAWVVPYSDLGYTCEKGSCAYENHTGPGDWLVSYAATTFNAVFVQDPYRNGVRDERFRYEIHALDTLADFTSAVNHYTAVNAWAWR